jgi:hypothetical protein
MVVVVAPTRQPDAAVDHRQLAGPRCDADNLASDQPTMVRDSARQVHGPLLPFQHQSPGYVASIIVINTYRIQ